MYIQYEINDVFIFAVNFSVYIVYTMCEWCGKNTRERDTERDAYAYTQRDGVRETNRLYALNSPRRLVALRRCQRVSAYLPIHLPVCIHERDGLAFCFHAQVSVHIVFIAHAYSCRPTIHKYLFRSHSLRSWPIRFFHKSGMK